MPKKKYPNTKNHIQECAIQLFKEYGYENVTIMQICEHAGITKRTFYYHFPSKSGVVFEYKNYLYKQAEGTVVDMLADQRSYVDILWALLNTFSVYREQGIDILRQIYTHTLSGNSEDEVDFPYSSYSYNTIVKTVANAQQAGEIRNNRDPADLAFTLQHLFRGVLFTWAAANGTFDLSERFRYVFDTLLDVADTAHNGENE
jgi:AcrR family transcriptional regulator